MRHIHDEFNVHRSCVSVASAWHAVQGEADDVYTAMESGERPSPTPRNTSLVSRVLVDFRVLDILALAIIALVLAGPSSVNRKQYVPQVSCCT